MQLFDLLLIISLALLCYGLAPFLGAFISRHSWRVFRQRFNDLCLSPILDYTAYQRCVHGGRFRFIGGFESITDEYTLWIRAETISIPVSLSGRYTYLFSITEEGDEETPERIRWDRVSSLTEGIKIFVGGSLALKDERLVFVSSKEEPLFIIFYDGNDRSLPIRAIHAGRNKNEYWNPITPYAFILGAFSQLLIVLSFLSRPTFRVTSIVAFIALFTPIIPFLPPGLLCTVLYNSLWHKARQFRGYRDVARLPLKYLSAGVWRSLLPDGELYGMSRVDTLPEHIPLLLSSNREKDQWYVFGRIDETPLPREPDDLFATFGAIQGDPEILAHRYAIKAHILEIVSGLFLIIGLGINLFSIILILHQLHIF
ncbi:MAG: hypothetical protein LBD79_03855 [Treponema sp.]|nr:hypothetical protein [Treponema sp.]